jgi:hypothetical protein
LVTKLSYDYFNVDFDRWETVDQIRHGDDRQPETPGRLRLTFSYGERSIDAVVSLPVFGRGLPPF